MEQRILYKDDEGNLIILCPTSEFLRNYTIEEIAAKDVPFNKPFKILNAGEIPSDRTFRNAWTVNDDDLNDGVGADYDSF